MGKVSAWHNLQRYSSDHLGPIYNKCQHQHSDDTCDSILIENNGFNPEWGCNPFLSDSIIFNENRIASIIAALMLMLGVNGPLLTHSG